jgi:hypothetical protein
MLHVLRQQLQIVVAKIISVEKSVKKLTKPNATTLRIPIGLCLLLH